MSIDRLSGLLIGGMAAPLHILGFLLWALSILIQVRSSASLLGSVGVPLFSPAETLHVLSVTVFMYSSVPALTNSTATILYTTDGTAPVRGGSSTMAVASGSGVFIDTIGTTLIRAVGTCTNLTDSAEGSKTYIIQGRASKPLIEPAGGTFAGSVTVVLGSSLVTSKIFYTLDGSMPTTASPLSVDAGKSIVLHGAGTTLVRCIAYVVGVAPSSVSEATFTLMPKVEPVAITPDTDTFTVSATLVFSCATPGASIHYTVVDGAAGDAGYYPQVPSYTSLTVPNGGSVTIDRPGRHTVKALALEQTMLAGDVSTKVISVLARLGAPRLQPPAGDFVGDVQLTFLCSDAALNGAGEEAGEGGGWGWTGGSVYYTTDETATPSVDPQAQQGQGQGQGGATRHVQSSLVCCANAYHTLLHRRELLPFGRNVALDLVDDRLWSLVCKALAR